MKKNINVNIDFEQMENGYFHIKYSLMVDNISKKAEELSNKKLKQIQTFLTDIGDNLNQYIIPTKKSNVFLEKISRWNILKKYKAKIALKKEIDILIQG